MKLDKAIVLENETIKLIPFEDERNQELKEVIFDDSIWKYMGQYIRTEEDFENYIESTLDDKERGICYPFLIVDKKQDKVVGSTRLGYLNFKSQKCEIGWTWLGTNYQGTGINKACKFELLDFGFNELKFKRIQFSADVDNTRSQKAIQNLGALKEGVFRNNYVDSNGESRTDVYFSIIQEEWDSIKQDRFTEYI